MRRWEGKAPAAMVALAELRSEEPRLTYGDGVSGSLCVEAPLEESLRR